MLKDVKEKIVKLSKQKGKFSIEVEKEKGRKERTGRII